MFPGVDQWFFARYRDKEGRICTMYDPGKDEQEARRAIVIRLKRLGIDEAAIVDNRIHGAYDNMMLAKKAEQELG